MDFSYTFKSSSVSDKERLTSGPFLYFVYSMTEIFGAIKLEPGSVLCAGLQCVLCEQPYQA